MGFSGDLEALVLGVLAEGPAHGYQIAKSISARTDKLMKVGEGKMYPALHRMERDGFIAAEWIPQEGKPDRKQYSLTPAGKTELVKHRVRWEKFAQGVNSILSLKAVDNRG